MVSKAGKTGKGHGFQGRKNRKGAWFPRQEKQEMGMVSKAEKTGNGLGTVSEKAG